MLEFLVTNQYVAFFIAILGIVSAFWFEYKGRKYRRIAYTSETMQLSSKNSLLGKVDFSIKNKKIDTLSITDVLIWSAGKEVINNIDIAPHNPLKINITPSTNLLDYQLLLSNDEDNVFQLTNHGNSILLNFDYMSKGNGVAIRIYHTGSHDDISVSCKIKDGKKLLHVKQRNGLFYNFLNRPFVKNLLSTKKASFIFLIFTIVLFPNAFIQSANYNTQNNIFNLPEANIFMHLDSLIILILCLSSFVIAIPHVYNLFKFEPPKELLDISICER